MTNFPQLHTQRLLLRRFQATDAKDVQKYAGAYEVAEMTLNIPHPYLDGMARAWMDSHQQDFELGRSVVFALVSRSSNQLVGTVGLILEKRFNRAELGYWIGKPFWGQGFATEASTAVLQYGFNELKLNRIFATHMTRNPASGRVLEKIGMTHEGTLRQHALKWDSYVDLAAYGILHEAWQELNES